MDDTQRLLMLKREQMSTKHTPGSTVSGAIHKISD